MRGSTRLTERTPLTRAPDSPDYVEFASLLRTRRSRIRQFQCCICATFIVLFTMALVITISYSMNHIIADNTANLTSLETQGPGNLSGPLKLGFTPDSGSYTFFSNTVNSFGLNTIFGSKGKPDLPMTSLSDKEFKEGLMAGQKAIDDRLSADATALSSPLPLPSPESRHRYAVSTCASVGPLALAAIAELAATKKIENLRSSLEEPSSIGSYFNGGWLPSGICKELVSLNCTIGKYRTYDGSCNRPMQWGASMTPFKRILAPSYANAIDTPRSAVSGKELPSAREISLKVHKPSPSSNPSFTVMLAVYGQFLDHDITATAISQGVNGSSISCCPPAVGHPECFPVKVDSGDPVFDVAGRTCMEFVRSAPAPQCKLGPREQLNQVSAFIDGSTIYGSDIEKANDLREFVGGRLKMQTTPDNRTLLPPSTNPNDGCNREAERLRGRYCFAAGDARANENLHLTTMHLLWARQHNRIADELAKVNPTWVDEMLYQEARRIVGAQLQHITYQEFVPIILGEEQTKSRLLRPLKIGYRHWIESPDEKNNNPAIANSFASAAFRFAHTLLPGLMRMTDEKKGTSSYVELHRMLFNPYSLYSSGGVESSVASATENVVQMTSTHVTSQLTNHLFEDPIGNATIPCGLDLVSLNIQRGRDHGLPGYTQWREYCGLGKPEAFSDLQGHMDPQALEQISMLYESVHDIDLYTGALAELPESGAIVGPTFTCLIADQFTRLQKGDRFWYEIPGRPHSFTEGQLQELRKTSLAKLICDCSDGVTKIQAEVMRSVGASNPVISCEDIPGPSFAMWKEDQSVPVLKAPMTAPFDWIGLKTNINETVNDILSYINVTAKSITPGTADWIGFRNYINGTFSDLRNQLAALHPKVIDASSPITTSVKESDSVILEAVTPASTYQDWISFKINLIKSLSHSIGTIGGGPADPTQWIEFKENIASQVADLKKQINSTKAVLSPKLLMEKFTKPKELKTSEEVRSKNKNGTMGTLTDEEAATLSAIFDWKNFKDEIIESVDNGILNIGNNMPAASDPAWASFGADIKDKFIALRDKINASANSIPKEMAMEPAVPFADWLSYKVNIIRTVNNAVQEVQNGMPPPGDPSWITYRVEIMKKFSAFKPKPSTPREMATDEMNAVPPFADWLSFKTDIIRTVNDAVQKIQDDMPPPGDPSWIAYRNKIINSFSSLKPEPFVAPTELEKSPFLPGTANPKPGKFQAAAGPKFTANELANLTTDWLDFRNKINDSLERIMEDIHNKKPTTIDPIGWMAFKISVMNEFAGLKNEINDMKIDWVTEINKMKAIPTNAPKALAGGKYSFTQFDDTQFWKPVIPAADWIAFKQEINDTIMDFLNAANSTGTMNFAEIPDMFNKSLSELKDGIVSLKQLVTVGNNASIEGFNFIPDPTNDWEPQPIDLINFPTQFNSTINGLVRSFKNESNATVGNLMKILFQAKSKLADLEPPASLLTLQSIDWIGYTNEINKTLTDAIKEANNLKSTGQIIKAEPALSSSETSTYFMNWLTLQCVAILSTYLCRY